MKRDTSLTGNTIYCRRCQIYWILVEPENIPKFVLAFRLFQNYLPATRSKASLTIANNHLSKLQQTRSNVTNRLLTLWLQQGWLFIKIVKDLQWLHFSQAVMCTTFNEMFILLFFWLKKSNICYYERILTSGITRGSLCFSKPNIFLIWNISILINQKLSKFIGERILFHLKLSIRYPTSTLLSQLTDRWCRLSWINSSTRMDSFVSIFYSLTFYLSFKSIMQSFIDEMTL